ncbi:MAG: response regulator transcription factor [Aureispira sp.]|nr:response regulator transcription factor [Aureispira sp.]
MKAIIIDDESRARNLLSTILKDYCPEVKSFEQAPDLLSGVELIRKTTPDIVFLDVDMPDHLGIEIGNFLNTEELNFYIIFTTAHSHYATKAFELNALDYLLKPLRPKQVREAVHKASCKVNNDSIRNQLQALKTTIEKNTFKKIGLPVSEGVIFVKLEDIICIEADGMYSKVYLQGGKKMQLISKPLKYFLSILDGVANFYKPHRSFVINMQHIQQYVKKDGHYIIMENDIMVNLSKHRKDEFVQKLNQLI